MSIRNIAAMLIALPILVGCGTNATSTTSPVVHTASTGSTARWTHAPAMSIDVHHTYDAIVTTNFGQFTIQLFTALAPHTVNNFIFLARHHFYDGDLFFRIIQSYMVQTGDPKQDGTGGPGYSFADELPTHSSYSPGIVAMANSGPDTNGSQFFICTGPEAAQILDAQPNYTQFGRVISGMSVVEKIARVPVTTNPNMQNEQSLPMRRVQIEQIVIKTQSAT